MDNASKALIIAGAILIAVMLVSLGVMLYNTAAGVAETTTGSVQALGVAGFNAQFETYLGTGKTKAQAAGLVSKVLSNNANNDIFIYINFVVEHGSGDEIDEAFENEDLNDIRFTINAARNVKYNIDVDEYSADGTIESITITQVDR